MFCSQTNHRIKDCPIAHEYVRTGKAVVINNRIHLSNGQPIPTNIMGVNLQAKIDTWNAGTVTTTPTHPTDSTFPRESPPHATHSFEIVYNEPIRQAHIVEIQDVEEESEDDDEEDIDLFGVYATERKKRNAKASQLSELTRVEEIEELITPATATPNEVSSSPIIPIEVPSSTNKTQQNLAGPTSLIPDSLTTNNPFIPSAVRTTPQYRYQSNAEDQQLVSELYKWLLDGKLSLVTPAHVLAACPAIRKELVERLRTRKVDTASFEQPRSSSSAPSISEPDFSTLRAAEYSLPLREIDVLINNTISEAGVLDQGSQIVVIRQDLAQEAGVIINRRFQLEMEGANGLVSKTLGCAENLIMQIGDVAFKVHAHVVDRAPFRLLLGRPFHNLLLCRLEDHSDGRVDVSVRDPANPTHFITIPSRARKAQVGFVRALAITSIPAPPSFKGLRSQHTLVYQFLDRSTPKHALAYKKVARKVRPVSASLPEDYRIIRRIPIDPLLSLSPLPTHPPEFTPGIRLTQERLDDLELNRYGFLCLD